jgi:hypothetical protein
VAQPSAEQTLSKWSYTSVEESKDSAGLRAIAVVLEDFQVGKCLAVQDKCGGLANWIINVKVLERQQFRIKLKLKVGKKSSVVVSK